MLLNHIGFDIDGTLIDELGYCVGEFLSFYQQHYGKKYSGKIDMTQYDIAMRFPDCRDKDFMELFTKWYWNKYVKEAPFRPFVKDLFDTLKKMGVTIHVVTARTPHDGKTWEDVEAYTKERFEEFGIPVDEYHIGIEEKESVVSGAGIELLVEDCPKQIWNVSEKIPVFVVDTPYNKDIRGKNIWRIDTFNPKVFIDEVKYARNHLDIWTIDYQFESGNEDSFVEDSEGMEFTISNNNTICFNQSNITKKNIIFVIPFGNNTNTAFAEKLADKVKNPIIVDLGVIEQDMSHIDLYKHELVVHFMRKENKNGIDLTDPNSTDAYITKCNIIEGILKYAENKKDTTFIITGIQSMMLKRDITEEYADNTIFITGASNEDILKVSNSKYRKGYNPWILMEDLTEVATQIRKWKIIAGTAEKDLPTYINRQTSTADGIDIVRLLPGEEPYNPKLLDSVLSGDTYCIGDIHLSHKDEEKTTRIIRAINKTVSKKDHLLFLGDFDGKKGTGSPELVKKFLDKLNCKNVYLILGNNDPYTIKKYKELGFLSVVDMATYQESPQRKVILTHCPYPVERDEVNIHGHIHGSRIYWNMDWEQHYDVWDENWVPIKISKCLEILDKDEYHARSEVHNTH